MNNENDEMDLFQQELSNILKQLQNEMDGTSELEIEEIHGVNLKELEKALKRLLPHEISELAIWLRKFTSNKPELHSCLRLIN